VAQYRFLDSIPILRRGGNHEAAEIHFASRWCSSRVANARLAQRMTLLKTVKMVGTSSDTVTKIKDKMQKNEWAGAIEFSD
jgi:hypothetical protein